jgi:hypothetical protein
VQTLVRYRCANAERRGALGKGWKMNRSNPRSLLMCTRVPVAGLSPFGGSATSPVRSASWLADSVAGSLWRVQWRALGLAQTRICSGLKRSRWRVGGAAATEHAAMGEPPLEMIPGGKRFARDDQR